MLNSQIKMKYKKNPGNICFKHLISFLILDKKWSNLGLEQNMLSLVLCFTAKHEF